MSKRNIKHKSGKQLYLNQIFYKGMLYTSSEMQEGYAKVIDNYDISPTGDAASPRRPVYLDKNVLSNGRYVYPVKFKHDGVNKQSYIKFDRVISENDFINDIVDLLPESTSPYKSISVLTRNNENLNGSGISLSNEIPYYTSDSTTGSEDNTNENYINIVEENDGKLFLENIEEQGLDVSTYIDTKLTVYEGPNNIVTKSIPTFTNYGAIVNNINDNDIKTFSSSIPHSFSIRFFNKDNYEQLITNPNTIMIIDYDSYSYDKNSSIEAVDLYSSNNLIARLSLISITKTDLKENSLYNFLDDNEDKICLLVNHNYIKGVNYRNDSSVILLDELPYINKSDLNINKTLQELVKTDINTNIISEVIDGDTFVDTYGNKHRIFGIDTRELGTKWGDYAKVVFENFKKSIPSLGNYYMETIDMGKDIYNRRVSILNVYRYETIDYTYYLNGFNQVTTTLYKITQKIDYANFILNLGLATIRYFDKDLNPGLFNSYSNTQNDAAINQYKIFSEGTQDFDPYYISKVPSGSVGTQFNDNLLVDEDMIIEAVYLEDSYQISPKTNTSVNCVHCEYVDYLDAVAFIGRIIKEEFGDYRIKYKGCILIKPVSNENNETFYNILLPTNKGEGTKPSIVDAVSEGYNLKNSDMINIDNIKKNTQQLYIAGIVPLLVDNNKSLYEPYSVVNQCIQGQSILLKSIINEDGYFKYSPTTTDSYGFEAHVSPISFTITRTISENGVSTTVTKEKELNDIVIKKNPGDFTSQSSYIFSARSSDHELDDVVNWTNISTISINKLYIIKPNGEKKLVFYEPVNVYKKSSSGTYYDTKLFNGCVFELIAKTELLDNGLEIVVSIRHNLNYINQRFEEHTIDGYKEYTLITRPDTEKLTMKIYSEWFDGSYNSDSFTPITNSKKHVFTLENGSLIKTNDWIEDSINKPTDLLYDITHNYNITIKHSLYPTIPIILNNDCPNALKNIELVNSVQELYSILPLLKVGSEIEYTNNEDLKENIDFENATRISVFNNQICLYGPYTKSNSLFFSKFEKFDYFAFPYSTVDIGEPIVYVYNYKDSLMIFGKYNMYMLSGAVAVNECILTKVYENLSIKFPEINTVRISGNNLIFFSNGFGYVVVPNTYVDNANNIKVYKLTENISNFFYNPEAHIRTIFTDIPLKTDPSYSINFNSYVQNNNIIIVANIKINGIYEEDRYKTLNLVTWFIYNQDYKYWRMYSTTLFDEIVDCYICEPNYNNQFLVLKDNKIHIAYFASVYNTKYCDSEISNNNINEETSSEIVTTINSGYLSVDTMNDKRFKDIIIEFDNLQNSDKLTINANFYVDSSPVLLSSEDITVVDKLDNERELEVDKELDDLKIYDVRHIGIDENDDEYPNDIDIIHRRYGTTFSLNGSVQSTSGRTHVRIPVFGKGRLPSFILKIKSKSSYEFINYALIYKEKDINRRS